MNIGRAGLFPVPFSAQRAQTGFAKNLSLATPQFGASLQVPRPTTLSGSRAVNARMTFDGSDIVTDLTEQLDEIMTTRGEAYSGKEAFTTLYEVKFAPNAAAVPNAKMDGSLTTQVDAAFNVGKAQNIGLMILSSEATRHDLQQVVATSRAVFNAIEPASVQSQPTFVGALQGVAKVMNSITGNLSNGTTGTAILNWFSQSAASWYGQSFGLTAAPVQKPQELQDLSDAWDTLMASMSGRLSPGPVTALQVNAQDANEVAANTAANDWNNKMGAFYKNVFARYAKLPLEDLTKVTSSDTRLVNSEVYVKPKILNKKRTGHGGATIAMALRDMASLAKQYTGNSKEDLAEFTSTLKAPFLESDALQFDTTVDLVDATGIYLSTRINKVDTKAGTAEGPIMMVNAKIQNTGAKALDLSQLSGDALADAQARQQEAEAWKQTRN